LKWILNECILNLELFNNNKKFKGIMTLETFHHQYFSTDFLPTFFCKQFPALNLIKKHDFYEQLFFQKFFSVEIFHPLLYESTLDNFQIF